MKKAIAIIAIITLALLASCTKKQSDEIVEVLTSDDSAVEQQTPTLTPYSDDMLGQADNTVLFFHSASCGSCRATEKNLLESGIPDNLQILKINFDEDSELRKKYKIATYHTFVQVDANGEAIKTWSGSFTVEDIQEQLVISETPEIIEQETKEEVIESDKAVEIEIETEPEAPVALTSGQYTDYEASLVGSTTNTVLFFSAAWCPSCVAADAGISSGTVPDDLTILKVDFDNSKDLRKKHGVSSQHTFVQVDADGNQITKWSGGTTLDHITSELK